MLLHYLACIWIFIGSDYFTDHEEGYTPWIANNDDFAEFDSSQLVIFATYWVCTVITTVGYGDYYGTTTLELEYTILLEFLGFVIFSVLQIGVLQIVNAEK